MLPSMSQLNPLIVDNEQIKNALITCDFSYDVYKGYAPGSSLAGDQHGFGFPGFYFLGIINSKWRPGGVGVWPQQPPTSYIPLVAGNVVRCNFVRAGYEFTDSNGHSYSSSYSHNLPGVGEMIQIFLNTVYNDNQYISIGGRYFGSSVYNSHPTYGFNAQYICVMKDDQPFVYDRISRQLFQKLGGEIGIGPKVNDDWNPLTWSE